jgi:excisionase family DNA binding protein
LNSFFEIHVSIGEAAKALGVSITTLRRWEASGRIQAEHTVGGHRRYGSRSRKNQKLLDNIKAAVEDTAS